MPDWFGWMVSRLTQRDPDPVNQTAESPPPLHLQQ